VIEGDALRVLPSLPAGVFDAVVTDCPYSSGGMTRGDRTASTKAKYVNSGSVSGNLLADFAGDTRDQRSFAYWCALWYSECLRVTKPGGVLLTFTDWRQLPSSCDSVQAGGWVWRGIVPWNKTEAARPQSGRPRAQCEYVLFATKGPHKAWEAAPAVPGFITCTAERDRKHIAQKPLELMMKLVELVPPGGRLLDPFAGVGSTGLAAVRLGRYPVLVEMVPDNVTIINERLAGVGNDDPEGQRNLFTETKCQTPQS
jgi:site-specific DNA-methyltransferase (adenine-specific)